MTAWNFHKLLVPPLLLIALAGSGCGQSGIDQNNKLLADQQAELDQLKQQVVALQTQQNRSYAPAVPPGGCDHDVGREATRKGGERLAAGDTGRALGYYQDAVTACHTDATAHLNLAHAYEALGERDNAIAEYRKAVEAPGPNTDAQSVSQARDALSRLGHGI